MECKVCSKRKKGNKKTDEALKRLFNTVVAIILMFGSFVIFAMLSYIFVEYQHPLTFGMVGISLIWCMFSSVWYVDTFKKGK